MSCTCMSTLLMNIFLICLPQPSEGSIEHLSRNILRNPRSAIRRKLPQKWHFRGNFLRSAILKVIRLQNDHRSAMISKICTSQMISKMNLDMISEFISEMISEFISEIALPSFLTFLFLMLWLTVRKASKAKK